MSKPANAVMLGLAVVILVGLAAGCQQPGMAGAEPHPEALSEMVQPAEGGIFIAEKHFVVNWLLLGPFKFEAEKFKGDQQQDATDYEFVKNEAALDGSQEAPEGTKWQAKRFAVAAGADAGQIDLDELYGAPEYAAAYAVAWIKCPEAMDKLKLRVGSDDYIKIWINGKHVHTYKEKRRASDWDQDVVQNVSLKKGVNRIVVKCVDVVFDWDFYLRFTDAADKAIALKQPK